PAGPRRRLGGPGPGGGDPTGERPTRAGGDATGPASDPSAAVGRGWNPATDGPGESHADPTDPARNERRADPPRATRRGLAVRAPSRREDVDAARTTIQTPPRTVDHARSLGATSSPRRPAGPRSEDARRAAGRPRSRPAHLLPRAGPAEALRRGCAADRQDL